MPSETEVKESLKQVLDPELNMDLVSLGLIYKIEIEKETVVVTMTLTSPMCPYGPELLKEVNETVRKIQGVKDVTINLTFEPRWEMPEEVKMMFGV